MGIPVPNDVGRILVVDHDRAVLEHMRATLETLGCKVLTATEATEGLRLLKTQDVELILAELRMSPISGEVLLACAHAVRPDVRRVIMAAPEDVAEATALISSAGLMALVTKPWNDDALRGLVVQGLIRRNAMRPPRAASHHIRPASVS